MLYVPMSESGTLYVTTDGTTPSATAFSMELDRGDSWEIEVTDDVDVKAIASTGTITVKVTELS